LLAVNEERYMRELPARIVRSQSDPNAIAPPSPEHAIVSTTPKRRRKGPCMSRRRGQTGYVWQKNQTGDKTWDATASAYGQIWIDVPGKEKRQRKFYQLGECRTKSEAKRRLKEMIEKDGINSTVDIAQSIDSTTSASRPGCGLRRLKMAVCSIAAGVLESSQLQSQVTNLRLNGCLRTSAKCRWPTSRTLPRRNW